MASRAKGLLVTPRQRHRVQRIVRDAAVGLAAFWGVAAATGLPSQTWTVTRASAADHLAARAIGATSPPGLGSENAILDAVLLGASPVDLHLPNTTLVAIALTVSLLFAFNIALVRHLRRAYASPRRGGWRRGH